MHVIKLELIKQHLNVHAKSQATHDGISTQKYESQAILE
jgi:hypothetical protein